MFLSAVMLVGVFWAEPASADASKRVGQRKFLVILASSPKQYPGPERDPPGMPTGGLINPQPIWEQYFDTIADNGVGSFAEYWEEITYGEVTIGGEGTDWVILPWAIEPPLVDPADDDPIDGPPPDAPRVSPETFTDLNGNGTYQYGSAEGFNNLYAAVIIDLSGDPWGTDDGPFFPGPGSFHGSEGGLNAGRDVWRPGERYLDVDGDNKWDGLDEANNWMDWLPPFGKPDLAGPWIDLNGNNQPDNAEDCVYLADSDNDGDPDCCPDGPGTPGCEPFYFHPDGDPPHNVDGACPPTQWSSPNGEDVIDCNGNLIPDAQDIEDGTSQDRLPFIEDNEVCVPLEEGDGIPDECQFEDPNEDCRDPAIECDPDDQDPTPCCGPPNDPLYPPCVLLEREPNQRCEFADSNASGVLDLVEPFENFLRRWDPCYFDPDASPTNANTTRAHWIKVYDPGSESELSCDSPETAFAYAADTVFQPVEIPDPDNPGQMIPNPLYVPSYIENNYPGPAAAVVAMSQSRVIFGQHDPEGLAIACVCHTAYDPDGDGPLPESTDCFDLDINDDGTIDPEETGLCWAGIHAAYDPPDTWTDAISEPGPDGQSRYTTKLRAAPGSNGEAFFVTATPQPGQAGSPFTELGEAPWFEQAWENRYSGDFLVQFYGVAPSAGPPWPMGFDPEGDPVPGGPPTGQPIPNTLLIEQWDELDPGGYDPAVSRRFFKANFGGRNGDGTGWIGQGNEQLFFETGPLGQQGFEERLNVPILPEEVDGPDQPGIYFDGYLEHDDLPSSKYHRAGDERLGEVTSPFNHDPWGQDLGDHDPGTPGPPTDLLIPAAGPLAVDVHGLFGRDAGNLQLMEYLTWRTDGTSPSYGLAWEETFGTTHPYAGPGTGLDPNELIGFRDYNLDGMIDQGEVRVPGSENYVSDAYQGTPNSGSGTEYPWNRQRLIEDCIEVLDAILDFDDFEDAVTLDRLHCDGFTRGESVPVWYIELDENNFIAADGVVSGIVLLPAGATANVGHAFFGASPLDYAIHNEDNDDPEDMFPKDPAQEVKISWNLVFADLVVALDAESPEPLTPSENFHTTYAAHSYLHSWEGFPDLYDYDIYGPPGPPINCPVGYWDIMARGGLVHPMPLLKERPCTEWIAPVDLTSVLVPGVEQTLTLPPCEFVREDSAYFLENNDQLGERYYFWSVGEGFDQHMPGAGMLILHHYPDPLYPRYLNYEIVPADGSIQDNCGDDGDPWPGSTGNTTFNCITNPPAGWYTQEQCTGLDVTDIVPDGFGSITLTLSWVPTSIPSLRFINPPGGSSIDLPPAVIYQVRAQATDAYGGTWLRFFYSDDENDTTIDPDGGNFIGAVKKTGSGSLQLSANWNILDVPDGQYFLFAELIPGPGWDGTEASYTEPRPGRNNVGDGTITVTEVDTNEIVANGLHGSYVYPNTFVAFTHAGDPVDFENEGVAVGDQLTTDGFSDLKPVLRTISNITTVIVDGAVLPALELATEVNPPEGPPTPENPAAVTTWQIAGAARAARSETWVAKCIDPAGMEWAVTSSLTLPADGGPYPLAITGAPYTSIGGEVTFSIDQGADPFAEGDTFTFTATGITAASQGIAILDGQIGEQPTMGDWDGDADVDLDDYAVLAVCLETSGPFLPPLFEECSTVFDFDGDGDVDLHDFGSFEQIME